MDYELPDFQQNIHSLKIYLHIRKWLVILQGLVRRHEAFPR